MKKLLLSVLFLLFSAPFVMSQTCNCRIVPYNPATCFESCTASIIRDASIEELFIIGRFKKEIAEKIAEINKKKKVETIEDYKDILKENFSAFAEKLKSLDEGQIKYFQQPVKERQEERKQLGKIFEAINKFNAENNTVTVTAVIDQKDEQREQ